MHPVAGGDPMQCSYVIVMTCLCLTIILTTTTTTNTTTTTTTDAAAAATTVNVCRCWWWPYTMQYAIVMTCPSLTITLTAFYGLRLWTVSQQQQQQLLMLVDIIPARRSVSHRWSRWVSLLYGIEYMENCLVSSYPRCLFLSQSVTWCVVQKRLNWSRSCLGWRLLGAQGTLY